MRSFGVLFFEKLLSKRGWDFSPIHATEVASPRQSMHTKISNF